MTCSKPGCSADGEPLEVSFRAGGVDSSPQDGIPAQGDTGDGVEILNVASLPAYGPRFPVTCLSVLVHDFQCLRTLVFYFRTFIQQAPIEHLLYVGC